MHTNIIAGDWKKLSLFYQKVFGCEPLKPQRDLKGDWLNRLTGVPNAHITGEHLVLPGYGDNLPTLEIFSYENSSDCVDDGNLKAINRKGLAHLAFEVDDIDGILQKIKQEGGEQLGEKVSAQYPNDVTATFVYAKDIEGNILELQNWHKQSG